MVPFLTRRLAATLDYSKHPIILNHTILGVPLPLSSFYLILLRYPLRRHLSTLTPIICRRQTCALWLAESIPMSGNP